MIPNMGNAHLLIDYLAKAKELQKAASVPGTAPMNQMGFMAASQTYAQLDIAQSLRDIRDLLRLADTDG